MFWIRMGCWITSTSSTAPPHNGPSNTASTMTTPHPNTNPTTTPARSCTRSPRPRPLPRRRHRRRRARPQLPRSRPRASHPRSDHHQPPAPRPPTRRPRTRTLTERRGQGTGREPDRQQRAAGELGRRPRLREEGGPEYRRGQRFGEAERSRGPCRHTRESPREQHVGASRDDQSQPRDQQHTRPRVQAAGAGDQDRRQQPGADDQGRAQRRNRIGARSPAAA